MSQQPEQANAQTWIVSPAFDLIFFANVWWLIAGLPWLVGHGSESAISFWQIYFLTTPHRWLTLVLVATDPDRREHRGFFFVSFAIMFAVLIVGVRLWELGRAVSHVVGVFTCLTIVDYVWNSWHFAAQHGGILRTYSRKAGGGRPRRETYSIRLLVTYVSLRLVGWVVGWTESQAWAQQTLMILDWIVLLIPASLLLSELLNRPRQRIGKVVYLASVVSLYGSLLLSLKFGLRKNVVALATASAAFHAIEYMAYVTYYARRRQHHGSQSLFRAMSKNWVQILALYMIAFGLFAAWMPGDRSIGGESTVGSLSTGNGWRETWINFWIGANLWAAYMHYALDGLIWKLRRTSTAKTLGVEIKASSTP